MGENMLSGKIIFYNESINKIVHKVDMKDVDIEIYQQSNEFQHILVDMKIGSVVTITHYVTHIIETTIYRRDLE
jgi:GH25 family lysozyme M1 (1,4-beta-N-acetylmuramidase)